jgi:hypothetical protein
VSKLQQEEKVFEVGISSEKYNNKRSFIEI